MDTLMQMLRRKMPGLGRRADHERSKAAAIKLNCIDCAGGTLREVELCPKQDCSFWLVRPGNGPREREPGVVPTLEQYRAWSEERTSPAAMEALAKARNAQSSSQDDIFEETTP